jgi:hypothetical protein
MQIAKMQPRRSTQQITCMYAGPLLSLWSLRRMLRSSIGLVGIFLHLGYIVPVKSTFDYNYCSNNSENECCTQESLYRFCPDFDLYSSTFYSSNFILFYKDIHWSPGNHSVSVSYSQNLDTGTLLVFYRCLFKKNFFK